MGKKSGSPVDPLPEPCSLFSELSFNSFSGRKPLQGMKFPRPRGGAFKSATPDFIRTYPAARGTVMAAPNVVSTTRLETPSPRPKCSFLSGTVDDAHT